MDESNIQPITKELLDSMSGADKYNTLEKYHKWLKKVRKQENKQEYNHTHKIHMFKIRPLYSIITRKYIRNCDGYVIIFCLQIVREEPYYRYNIWCEEW